ncbi:MAG: hypothetical protein FGM40_08370 [Rhodocyclaceae bacterium]|nr:hypothetical protein [Rhodocyclaceae bacterium]
MFKLLLLIALVGGGLWWLARGGRLPGGERRPDAGPQSPRGPAAEAMVRCEYCNTHVPQSAAVFAGKHGFCCEEHRAAAGY